MLLTLAEARTHITTALVDAALQQLLDAAEETITDIAGAVDTVSEIMSGSSGELVMLGRRASAIVSVVEQDIALAANDYELVGSSRLLRRLDDGTNPRRYWYGRLEIVYTPVSDEARRKVAQLALVRLDLDFNPNAASERIGDWTETFRTDAKYVEQRDDILAALTSSFVML